MVDRMVEWMVIMKVAWLVDSSDVILVEKLAHWWVVLMVVMLVE
jgi:hypothetical protein